MHAGRRGCYVLPWRCCWPAPQDPTFEELSPPGCCVALHEAPHTLLDGCFYVSGAIPRVTTYETGLPQHITQNVNLMQRWVGSVQRLALACHALGRWMRCHTWHGGLSCPAGTPAGGRRMAA